jgi:purine-cytosine permease-like protein
MTKRKYPRFNTKSKPRPHEPNYPAAWTIALIVILLIAAGLYLGGIGNGPVKQGQLNCTPAQIAANVPCR